MKKSLKKSVSSFISLSLFTSGMVAASAVMTTASAEVTFNAGVMSQYIFRGAVQRDSASLMGGADYTHESGFYAGVWAAQQGDEMSDPAPCFAADGKTETRALHGFGVAVRASEFNKVLAQRDELLAALQLMLDRAHPAHVGDDFMRQKLIDAREFARAAIAKVQA